MDSHYRYYTRRPLDIGTQPSPAELDRAHIVKLDAEDFGERRPVIADGVGRQAWAWVEYDYPLPGYLTARYELIYGGLVLVDEVTA